MGGMREGMQENVLAKEFFESFNIVWGQGQWATGAQGWICYKVLKLEGNGPVESAASRGIKDEHEVHWKLICSSRNSKYIYCENSCFAWDGIRTGDLLHQNPTPYPLGYVGGRSVQFKVG